MKRLLSLLLVLVTLVTCFPMAALNVSAEEADEMVVEAAQQEEVAAAPAGVSDEEIVLAGEDHYAYTDPNYPDNDELFAGYAESVFYGGSATYNQATGQLQTSNSAMYANAAGNRLSGDTKKAYNALVPIFKKLASGQRSSTTIYVVDSGATSSFSEDAVVSFSSGYYDLGLLHGALLSDLPYEQYWYDKTTGVSTTYWTYSSTGRLAAIKFEFTVAKTYRAYSYDPLYVDTSKTSAASTAAANARKIVSANASKSDYQKLVAYKKAICDRVEYDFDAVYYGDFKVNNNPWQMIYAFDNDPSTNIVCEGYSKAFMYLCDQSDFTGNVTCYTVTGDAGGPHMWNVVTIGGKNYLVDITNSDSGSIGQNGGLFLAGGSGSPSSGYYFMNNRMYFDYDIDTTGLWGTGTSSILYLSSTDYKAPAELKITTQPKNTCIKIGETGKVTVKATGEGLTYQWYYKNPGDTAFSKSPTYKTSTYSMKMVAKYSGRQVYCLIKDKYGNSVKTKTITLDRPVAVTNTLKNTCIEIGETGKVTVKAVGGGLTYKWYYKNPGQAKYAKSPKYTGKTYAMTMSAKYSGRRVYCVVTDKYGNTARSNVITLDQPVSITTQPKSAVTLAKGKTGTVSVVAVGKGLTYQWYYKNPGQTKFTKSPNYTGKTYSMTMVAKYAGRQVYCVIKDAYGNAVKTRTVTFRMN